MELFKGENKKTMDKNKIEIQRLTANLETIRQSRFQYQNMVFQYDMDVEYFTTLLQEISTKKVLLLSIIMEASDSWADDYNDDVKRLYSEVKKSYKETVDFFSELHKMATDKLNEAKIIQSEINGDESNLFKKKKNIEENGWFEVGLKFANGTIKYESFRKDSFDIITLNAGLPITLRPYFSDTYQNSGQKNIFKNENKMKAIFKYCNENDIIVSEWFLGEYEKFNY